MARWRPLFLDPSRYSDSATITASTESGEYVATNMQDQRPTRVWRSTNDTAANTRIKIDLGSAIAVNGLCMSHHNFSTACTITIAYADTNEDITSGSWTTLVSGLDGRPAEYGWGEGPWGAGGWYGYATSDSHPGYVPIFFYELTGQPIHRYWRISIIDESNADGYIQIGRIALDRLFEPENGIYWGYTHSINDISPIGRTGQGSFYSAALAKYQKIDGIRALATLREWEDFWLPVGLAKGISRDLYMLMDESSGAEARHVMRRHYGRFVNGTIPQWASGNVGTITFGFEQAL